MISTQSPTSPAKKRLAEARSALRTSINIQKYCVAKAQSESDSTPESLRGSCRTMAARLYKDLIRDGVDPLDLA